MKAKMTRKVTSIALACSVTLSLAYCACSGDSNSRGGTTVPDAGEDSAADAAAPDAPEVSTWQLPDGGFDGWPVAEPPAGLDCGPGCRIALNRISKHPSFYGHAYTATHVLDSNGAEVFFAPLGSDETRILKTSHHESIHPVEAAISEKYASFLWSTWPFGEVRVLRLSDGAEITFSPYQQQSDYGVIHTAVNNRYVFWMRDGVGWMRGDLTTGETKRLTNQSNTCVHVCATESGLICSSVGSFRVEFIDQETGAVSYLDDGGALQVDGACSPDRKRVAWVDYRDPPGRDSNYDSYRNGGEVYVRDLEKKLTTRVTWDSPDAPRGKTDPAVGEDSVIWSEVKPPCPVNPDSHQTLYGCDHALVWKRLDTGRVCRYPAGPLVNLRAVHGHHLYGYWLDVNQNAFYLADLDMDSPDIPWECE